MTHLTSIPNATLIAWHSDQDVQAVRIDGAERLYVDGRLIPLTDAQAHPTQMVINYCSAGKRTQCQFRKMWAAAVEG